MATSALTPEQMARAEELRELNLKYKQPEAVELRTIYNMCSGHHEKCCLCTPAKRINFQYKFYDWYDYR